MISVGDDHACAFGPQLASLCWGHNDHGVLGLDPTTSPQSVNPTAVGSVSTLSLIAGWQSCALTNGTVSCLGRGTEGQLGDGANTDSTTPRLVAGLTGVTALATGGGPNDFDASCAVTGGSVRCWGAGLFGRLGQGTADHASAPVDVVGLPGAATQVAIGYDHACALLGSGDIWCWGRGDRGQLGDGRSTSSLVPVRVLAP
jgi:alpha-tubulin suppressor-like RCC1 family protein